MAQLKQKEAVPNGKIKPAGSRRWSCQRYPSVKKLEKVPEKLICQIQSISNSGSWTGGNREGVAWKRLL